MHGADQTGFCMCVYMNFMSTIRFFLMATEFLLLMMVQDGERRKRNGENT